METKAYFKERPDRIKYMSLPSADTADVWMRKNIAEVVDPENGATSYEADEVYMRSTATEAEIISNFDTWYAYGAAWEADKPLSQAELIRRMQEDIKQTRADIDYIAMSMDLDLEV